MDFTQLLEKTLQQHAGNLPFVLFSLPEKNIVSALFQKNDRLYEVEKLSGNGFVFAPFDYKETAFFIPESESETVQCTIENEEIVHAPLTLPRSQVEKNKYIKLLNITIEAVKKRKADKIVISRYKDFPLENMSLEKLSRQLFSSYTSTFRYIWYHPKIGIWCGATPETLVHVENSSFKTMALAGTQPFTNKEPIIWGPKELDEQQLVTDAITNSLQKVTSVLKVSNPYTHKAGSLLHLRTDITGVLKNGKATLSTIAATLHPTPAICGTPQKFAKEFIETHEQYIREFYTGFLGPISENGASATLMVNLRCMKVFDNVARIFVGGGITIASQPEDEWQETQNKMKIMLQVLTPIL